MITQKNFPSVLDILRFEKQGNIYLKHFPQYNCVVRADFKHEKLIDPKKDGLVVNDLKISNLLNPQNRVVFKRIYRCLIQNKLDIKSLKDAQHQFFKKVKESEAKIKQNQKTIEESKAKKEQILKHYLEGEDETTKL